MKKLFAGWHGTHLGACTERSSVEEYTGDNLQPETITYVYIIYISMYVLDVKRFAYAAIASYCNTIPNLCKVSFGFGFDTNVTNVQM